MAEKYGLTEAEFQVVQKQAAKRAELRREFLKQRTNPWKNAAEAGHVFDSGLQRFIAVKSTQFEYFKPTKGSAMFSIFGVLGPMVVFGYSVWNERTNRENLIRTGQLRYKDRVHKLA